MSFSEFQLNDHLLKAVQRCGFNTPTPIQQQSIPSILAGRDLLGLAQTGTGKTAAFILPTVQHLMATPGRNTRALIIAPTRELAEQINEFTQTIIRHTQLRSLAVYGGMSKSVQISKIRQGVDILIACPGRLLDILNDKVLSLGGIEILVLDEADHMFDKGFFPDIRRILRQLPTKRQNLVFSATMAAEIRELAEKILVNPATVQINPSCSVKSISHRLFDIDQAQKTSLLMHLINEESMTSTLVFTRTKHKAKQLAQRLFQYGFKATSLQGNLSQNKRQQALDGFKNGAYTVLVATDIAARGIDVTAISHVINYDVPDTAETYIHRTGRTGRAACSGEALTFATREDRRMIQVIERLLDTPMSRPALPQLAIPSPPQHVQQEPAPARRSAPRKGDQESRTASAGSAYGKRRHHAQGEESGPTGPGKRKTATNKFPNKRSKGSEKHTAPRAGRPQDRAHSARPSTTNKE